MDVRLIVVAYIVELDHEKANRDMFRGLKDGMVGFVAGYHLLRRAYGFE